MFKASLLFVRGCLESFRYSLTNRLFPIELSHTFLAQKQASSIHTEVQLLPNMDSRVQTPVEVKQPRSRLRLTLIQNGPSVLIDDAMMPDLSCGSSCESIHLHHSHGPLGFGANAKKPQASKTNLLSRRCHFIFNFKTTACAPTHNLTRRRDGDNYARSRLHLY